MSKSPIKFVVIFLVVLALIIGGGYYYQQKTGFLQGSFGQMINPAAVQMANPAAPLTITAPSKQVADQLVLAGGAEVKIGQFKVNARAADFEISQLQLDITDSASADSLYQVTIKYPTNLATPTTLDGSSTMSFAGNSVTFFNLGFMVPRNTGVGFEVWASASPHSNDGGAADSGDALQLTVSNSPTGLEAIDQTTGAVTTGDEPGVLPIAALNTNKPYVLETLPTVAISGAANSPIITGSQREVFRFTVTADAAGDLDLQNLRLDVSSSGIKTDALGLNDGGRGTWEMFEVSGGVINFAEKVGEGEFTLVNGSTYMNIWDDVTNCAAGFCVAESVAAGATETYAITTTITDDGINNVNSISARLGSDSAAAFNQTATAVYNSKLTGALAEAAFVWKDNTGTTWHNGYKVTGLPTSYISRT